MTSRVSASVSSKAPSLSRSPKSGFRMPASCHFETSAASFLALQQGKVKATVYRYSEGKAVERNAGDGIKALRFLDEPLLSMPSGFAFRKGSPELVKAANDFLAQLETSGEGQKLYDKWLGKDSDLKSTRKFEFGKPQETWFTN
jgi:polar amino acid transport system substrate-binding protein